jgi:N-methylhydantoinase A
MVEIGAGGGSIAWVDALERLQVGPESAGSEPGPVCYGRGGRHPAVTDADLLLGKLDPATFADGRMVLDRTAAAAAMRADVAEPLGMNEVEAAYGVSEVVNENMAAAARAHLSEWGRGVSGRTLIAFGGAAPLHACTLATKLKIDRVVIPVNAGVGSAVGFLLAPVGFEVVRSRYMTLDRLDHDGIESLLQEMYEEALAVVGTLVAVDRLEVTRKAFMRYAGQGYEIAVELDEDLGGLDEQALRARFEANYRKLYGRIIPDLAVEILSWTLNLQESETAQRLPAEALTISRRLAPPAETRLFDPVLARSVQAACIDRDDLVPGDYLDGPALIREAQTTVLVATGFRAGVAERGSLILSRTEESA